MRKAIYVVLAAALACLVSALAMAHGGGGGSVGGGFSHGAAVGPSSSAAAENSNGRFAQDRDKGLDRAEDRKSKERLEHDKATKHKKPPRKERGAGDK